VSTPNKYRALVDALLVRVQFGKNELTVDAEEMPPEAVDALRAEAKARGMHVSGTRRWILIRMLEGRPAHTCNETCVDAGCPALAR
jgi:hypothetical protein